MIAQKYSLPLFFLITISLISPVLADDPDINISNFPTQLAERWGISEFASGIFLTMLLGLGVLMPLLLLKAKGIYVLFIGFGYLAFAVGIGWMPYWIMLLTTLIVAGIYAGKIKRML